MPEIKEKKVTVVKQREKNYGIKLEDGNWYNGWGQCPVEEGDVVSFEFETDESGFNNIKEETIEIKKEAGPVKLEKISLEKLTQIYSNCFVIAEEILTKQAEEKEKIPIEVKTEVATNLFKRMVWPDFER